MVYKIYNLTGSAVFQPDFTWSHQNNTLLKDECTTILQKLKITINKIKWTNSMKILALIGSSRKGGNTDILVDKLLEGAELKEHVYEKIYLHKYNISSCKACNICKKNNYICTMKDEMQEIYPKIDTSDVVVFGTPNYWFGPSGKMKLLIDRLLPYTSSKNLEGKKGILIVAAADGPEACGPLLEMFRMSFEYLNMNFIGYVVGTAYEKREILNDEKSMADAFNLGYTL